MRTIRERLNDLLIQVKDIEEFTQGGRDFFLRDRKTQNAVARCYEIIGEIVKQLPDELLSKHPEIAWQDIMRFRDFLIHSYHRVEYDFLWAAVEDLPFLREAILALHRDVAEGLNDQ